MRRFLNEDNIIIALTVLIVLIAIAALAHSIHVYSTCDGDVVRGTFNQLVCIEGAR